jgi:hypothetical protein
MQTFCNRKVIHTAWMGWEFRNEKLETGWWVSVYVEPRTG